MGEKDMCNMCTSQIQWLMIFAVIQWSGDRSAHFLDAKGKIFWIFWCFEPHDPDLSCFSVMGYPLVI